MSDIDIDATHGPSLKSWVESANGHRDFPVQNLPFGIFSVGSGAPRVGVAIGDEVLDLSAAAALLPAEVRPALAEPTLNALFALPRTARRELRRALSRLLTSAEHRASLQLHAANACTMHLPVAIGDYTDFYAGIHHAMNVGRQFRPDQPLMPNYKYVPIAYHGRASSIRAPGLPVRRPRGQQKAPDAAAPTFGPSRRLDYELELGIWIAGEHALGETIPMAGAADRIAGLCLLNDWSARDLQAWEYQPLGPFLAKSFHTTVSPWVITAEALAPFRIPQPPRPEGDPRPLDHLWDDADQARGAFALDLTVSLRTARMRESGQPAHVVSRSAAHHLYWTIAQMVTHHASNGCNLRAGDLFGTGTISGTDRGSCGSLLETTRGGAERITLPSGEERGFLEDGDEVVFEATAHAVGYASIGFGPCAGVIAPA